MGAQVQRVPGSSRVEASDADEFGCWLREERELRGISVYFVAARTKLSPERVRAIESGEDRLAEGHGRAVARSLAQAIGADPDTAARFFRRRGMRASAGHPPMCMRRPLLWFARIAAFSLAAAAAWLIAAWFASRSATVEGEPELVYRPDYVGRLLDPDR